MSESTEYKTSTSDKGDTSSVLTKESNDILDTSKSISIVRKDDINKETDTPDASESYLKPDKIKIVSVVSAVTDDSIKKIITNELVNDNSMKSVTSVPDIADSSSEKPPDHRNETRAFTLETIIRKGLSAQMPMTAKDIDNIVPNAIKQQQDAARSAKLSNDKDFQLVYESSDDYNSSIDEKFEENDVDNESNEKRQDFQSTEDTIDKTLAPKVVELPERQESEDHPNQPRSDASEEKSFSGAVATTDLLIKEMQDNKEETNSNVLNESSTSEQSFGNFDSESDSTHSTHKNRKRRKHSSPAQNILKDDLDKKHEDNGEELANDSGPRLNRRGKPRKSYDETESEEITKKVGRKLKIPRYFGKKRQGVKGRPKRDDGYRCYKEASQDNNSSGTTSMSDLMTLSHSIFPQIAPKKAGRPKRENLLPEINSEVDIETENDIVSGRIGRVYQNVEDHPTHPQLMFRRKPGRPKIDKESGGHIVFQNSELTVVNKPTKIKGEIIDPQDDDGAKVVHSKDISIVPIIKSVSTNKELNRGYNLPVETSIASSHDRSDQDRNIRNVKTDPSYEENTIYSIAPIDDMLEVHHVEEYIPEMYEGSEGRRRGRKPKVERSTYSEITLGEPYVLNSDKQSTKCSNGSGISVKNIEDLLEIPTRQPALQDFYLPELIVSTSNKSALSNDSRLHPVATNVAAVSKRVRGNRSGSQPTYAELSESSNDSPEPSECSRPKVKKSTWKQRKKVKPHWTEQWKANLASAKKTAALDGKSNINPESTSSVSVTPKEINQPLPTDPTEISTPKTDIAHKEFDKSVKEILQMRQKRIPKLKYSSYDFKIRRDPNKPKMVLKFKKKYYKKKKSLVTTQAASHDDDTCTSNHDSALNVQVEGETSVKVHKKPGPKPKPKLTAAEQLITPAIKSIHASTLTTSTETEHVRKKCIRKLNQPKALQPEPTTAPKADNVNDFQNAKRRSHDSCPKTISEKKVKTSKCNEPTSQMYLENYNKVLQDRNDVLLEILEQRSAEIRSLKMRVSNMTKSDEESKSSEKKNEESWSPAELSKAYSLQKLSKPFYRYVQDRFSLPLPPLIDIDRSIDGITLTKGLLTSMMQILEFDGETMSEVDRVTILQISELKMQSLYEYDDNLDSIVGPHSSMLVVVAMGLYSGWNQVVYLNFDISTIKPILNMIIEELHKIKFPVVACVCKYVDGEATSWSEFNIGMGCNYFPHPVTTDFIYTFYYIDDLMLATRNNFVENGFTTDTYRINKSPLVELIKVHDLRFPIQSETLTTKCDDIPKIVDLFSKHTSNLLRILMPNNEIATSLADFCSVLSSFYQLMNTDKGTDILDSKHLAKEPYGKDLEYQNDILNETQLLFYKLRCPGNSKMCEFQRATMMCIESLKMLQHSTKQKFKMDYFGTQSITREYLKKRIEQSLIVSNETLSHLTPLKSIGVIKDIFLQAKSADSLMYETTAKLFLDEDIDPKLSESHYVDLLINWIAEKHEKKHANANKDDFLKKMHKFEEMFQSIQNPQFKIAENSVTKVFKKLKSHTFGIFLEVIHKFVVQRHLLRIEYLNAVAANNVVKSN
ncbi:Transposable element P transposase [Pseudolycoriella hygida]|uniref:Transposable element P transposase n=1 Tax=Pseudolycoriella hygida TaxID=35572 RepID=A0A9Q0S228_9DIPT|nr:Transposable element P transposase [Pseudolycoriella hygida]